MIEIFSLVVAGVLVEYAIFASWSMYDRLLKNERGKSVFEFLEMLNGEEGLPG